MKKKRDMYAVSFIKLVDSAWKPRVDIRKFGAAGLNTSGDYVSLRTSALPAGRGTNYEPVEVRKFKSRDEFIAFMTQEAINAWERYEAEKEFDKECSGIVEDIMRDMNEGLHAEKMDATEPLEDFHDISRNNSVNEYRQTPTAINYLTHDEAQKKAAEIKEREVGDRWKPYMALKEILGVDLINTPDIATEDKVEEMRAKRPNAENNNGIVRRATGNRRPNMK